ncbi:MAG: sugar phosphate isomerase/epimerase [Ruminococcaceae bacterium]|nr:sugar phosphate isomerase/epimerase [Oscillospiraceae bacterium]
MQIGMTAGAYTPDLSVFEKELQTLKEIGFTCIDYQGFINTKTELFSLNDEQFDAYVLAQKRILEKVGMRAYQVHGPWQWPAKDDTEEGRAERFEKMAKSIRGTALLGSDRMVIHNLMPQKRIDTDPAAVKELNAMFLTRLCEVAKQYAVTICLENMPFACQCLARPRQTLEFVKSLGLENLRVCLDTGHAEVVGTTPADAVRLIGKDSLYALHVHDTDGLRDRHWIIGDGIIDWEDFGTALYEIGFDGCFSIESVIDATLPKAEKRSQLTRLYTAASKIIGT